MAEILIFFSLQSNYMCSLTNPVLEFKNQKNIFHLNKAISEANLNADKRISKCRPFFNWVYEVIF